MTKSTQLPKAGKPSYTCLSIGAPVLAPASVRLEIFNNISIAPSNGDSFPIHLN